MEVFAMRAQSLLQQPLRPAALPSAELQAAGRTAAQVPPAQGMASRADQLEGQRKDAASGQAGKGRFDRNECQTCKNRRYQDGSNDPGVSFKTPGKIDPSASQSRVRAHEYEHVFRERSKALREGREVVSQSVMLHTGICPECGRAYVSGGTTRTVTRKSQELDEILAARKQEAGEEQAE